MSELQQEVFKPGDHLPANMLGFINLLDENQDLIKQNRYGYVTDEFWAGDYLPKEMHGACSYDPSTGYAMFLFKGRNPRLTQ